ncbi:hypothetical protein CYD53_12031 [Bosea psychrotolerans]|uniref:Uncharacterized protein n=1 Tax=Bosea psychrotolerans TaxID=1871628 RepID=A0A2S4LXF4_9HYPH|nr:hypothetical protein CYD53_12031 [Bosea psychrotolerans]
MAAKMPPQFLKPGWADVIRAEARERDQHRQAGHVHHTGRIFAWRACDPLHNGLAHIGNSAKVNSPQPSAAPVTSRSRAENTNGPAIIA